MTERRRCYHCGRFTAYEEGALCLSCHEKEEEGYYDRMVDYEICPECGVVHGSNPYTGCGGEKKNDL